LAQVLRPVQDHPATSHADLLIGLARADDAGVYALGDGRALIQTIDIFTPVVDGAYDWGRIAAANALSDVYAMGGTPLTALTYLAWPRDELPFELASEVLRGGFDVLALAGCTVVGGHSIDSTEPTFGFAITGLSSEAEFVSLGGARVGDVLVLTKPVGTGIITTAIKRGYCPQPVAEEAIRWMTTLNEAAGAALVEFEAHAATDVTGFGLLGHLREMCRASGIGANVESSAVPIMDGAAELLAEGAWAGGSARNLASLASDVTSRVDTDVLRVLADAQTSGGLLVALDPGSVDEYINKVSGSVSIGRMTAGNQISIG
jgi:selenide,water dikinase